MLAGSQSVTGLAQSVDITAYRSPHYSCFTASILSLSTAHLSSAPICYIRLNPCPLWILIAAFMLQ